MFEDWKSIWHWTNRLKRGCLAKEISLWIDLSAATVSTLVHPGRLEPSGGTLQLWSQVTYQSANIRLSSTTKKPNASHTSRDADNLSIALSLKTTRTRNCWRLSGFGFVIIVSSDWVLLPSSHLIPSGTWMEVVAPEKSRQLLIL